MSSGLHTILNSCLCVTLKWNQELLTIFVISGSATVLISDGISVLTNHHMEYLPCCS
jgi:hypothetical protein